MRKQKEKSHPLLQNIDDLAHLEISKSIFGNKNKRKKL